MLEAGLLDKVMDQVHVGLFLASWASAARTSAVEIDMVVQLG